MGLGDSQASNASNDTTDDDVGNSLGKTSAITAGSIWGQSTMRSSNSAA